MDVKFDTNVLKHIAEQVKKEYPMENGRGVEKWIGGYIAYAILEKVEQENARAENVENYKFAVAPKIVSITRSPKNILELSVVVREGKEEL